MYKYIYTGWPKPPCFFKYSLFTEQEVGDDLGVCVLNLQIVKINQNSLQYIIKGSCDFMEGSSSLYVIILPGLVTIGIAVVEKIFFNLSRAPTWPCFQMVYHLMVYNFLTSVSNLLSLVPIGLGVVNTLKQIVSKNWHKQYLYKIQHMQIYLIFLLLFSSGINEWFYWL